MILIRKILLVTSLVLLLIATDVKGSWAVSFSDQQPVILNIFGNAKKDMEGKTQENIGKMTGNKKDQAIGKAKQVESKAAQNTQDTVSDLTDKVKGKAKDIKNSMRKGADEIKARV